MRVARFRERYQVTDSEAGVIEVVVDDAVYPDEAVVRLASIMDGIDSDWQWLISWPRGLAWAGKSARPAGPSRWRRAGARAGDDEDRCNKEWTGWHWPTLPQVARHRSRSGTPSSRSDDAADG